MQFPIIKYKKIWFSISTILVTTSLVLIFMGGLKLGIDFTGGSLIQISFDEKITTQEISEIFKEALGERGEKIVETEDGFIIRSRNISQKDKEFFEEKLIALDKNFEINRATSISATIGEAVKKDAFVALAIAVVAIILFIAFAFRKVPKKISPWKFGLTAVVALVHDVLITAGVFALLGILYGTEIDGLFITALLTVMGFSVHDTIVVFDRIRENLKGESAKDFENIAETALWQTMTRSLNTSFSTLMVLIALAIFGSQTIFLFVLALVVGITAGTYSSIFLATPLLVAWQKK